MHYYQFNIGDYASHTSRLSIFEDLAYRRLLDLYYLNERPFNGCSIDVARDIGMSDYQKEVDYILSKFFYKEGDYWANKRADEEIEAYKNKKDNASKAGKASAKARKHKASEQSFNGGLTDVQPNINHKPLTINQEPIIKTYSSEPQSDSKPVMDLPTSSYNSKGEVFTVQQSFVDQLSELYPNVDVHQAMRSIKAWLITNDKRRKTKGGMPKFINTWLSKEQDKPRAASSVKRQSLAERNETGVQAAFRTIAAQNNSAVPEDGDALRIPVDKHGGGC